MKIRNNVLELLQGNLSHTLNAIKHVDNVPLDMVIFHRHVPQLHMNVSTTNKGILSFQYVIAIPNKKHFV
jgi:hypothetical protein